MDVGGCLMFSCLGLGVTCEIEDFNTLNPSILTTKETVRSRNK